MKIKALIIVTAIICSSAYAGTFVNRQAVEGKISYAAPTSLAPMPKQMLEMKYPSSRRPTEVICNQNGTVSLAFNHTKNPMTQQQIKAAHAHMSKMFHNLYPSAKWIQDKTITKDGMVFMVFEFISPAVDTKIHNIMYGTSVNNRLFLVAFNSTVEESSKWIPIGKKIMKSLKFK